MKGAINQTIMLYANLLCRRGQIEMLIAEIVVLMALFNRQKKKGGKRRRKMMMRRRERGDRVRTAGPEYRAVHIAGPLYLRLNLC